MPCIPGVKLIKHSFWTGKRKQKRNMLSTAKKFKSILIFSILAILVVFAVVFALHFILDVPYRQLMADPNILTDSPIYYGFLSQVGILLWSATATTCFIFAYMTVFLKLEKVKLYFFIFSGLLISWLMLDDSFLIHEGILPGLGVPQKLVIMVYVLVVLFYLYRFKNLILKHTPYLLLAIAFIFFTISVLVDFIFYFETPNIIDTVLEDGSKFIGIVLWLAYILSCERLLTKSEE